MKILITGICGFAGSTLARHLPEVKPGLEFFWVDSFIRRGSELNWRSLQAFGITLMLPRSLLASILEEIAGHVQPNPGWLDQIA